MLQVIIVDLFFCIVFQNYHLNTLINNGSQELGIFIEKYSNNNEEVRPKIHDWEGRKFY